MKTIKIYHIHTSFTGYGHKKVYIETADGEKYSATTTNMPLTDMLQSDDEDDIAHAKVRLSEFVLSSNNIEFDSVELL